MMRTAKVGLWKTADAPTETKGGSHLLTSKRVEQTLLWVLLAERGQYHEAFIDVWQSNGIVKSAALSHARC